jgi:apolipoprotein N-acyltransferase
VQVAAITLDPQLNEALVTSWRERPEDWTVGPNGRSDAAMEALNQEYLAPIVDGLLTRSREAAQAGAKIVAWSEAAAFVFKEDEAELLERGRQLAMEERIYLEIGMVSLLPRREYPFNENRSILFGPDGKMLWDYPKTSVVPGDGNEPGPGAVPTVDTPYGRLAVLICFDGDFPSLARQAGRAGADILLLPSSDWDVADRPHADMAVLRAVESGMSVVRPTRQGFSSMLDPLGRTLAFGPDYFSDQVPTLIGTVPTKGQATIYETIGDAVPLASILILLASGGVAIGRSIGQRRQRRHPLPRGH